MTTTTAAQPFNGPQSGMASRDQRQSLRDDCRREATIRKAIQAANVTPPWSSFPKHGYRDIRLGCEGWGPEHEIIRIGHGIGDCTSCCRR